MDANPHHSELAVVNVPEKHRYELRDGTMVAGVAQYLITPDQIVFTHTAIDPAHRGRGLGSTLARPARPRPGGGPAGTVPVADLGAARISPRTC